MQPNALEYIQRLLESKSTAKQITYKNLLHAFRQLSNETQRIVKELQKKAHLTDEDVTLNFLVVNEHEFHAKLAGDLLIFVLHTNVVTFDREHPVMQDPYVQQNDLNRYFGQIMIYNFMADSLRFNRINDPGYLIARILINHENRFVVEADGNLGTIYNSISKSSVTDEDLNQIVKLSLTFAIENDLMAPPFPDVRFITLHQKLEKTSELGAGQKIGFRMSYQNKTIG